MAKIGPIDTSMKYRVTISFLVEGVVKKDDILGAIFGQLEPILPRDLYHKVQDKNRKDVIIQVDIEDHSRGYTKGKIYIYSRLDRYETAIIAAAIEMIKKVGAFKASFRVEGFDNMLLEYVEHIKRRAADLLLHYQLDYSLEPDLKKLKDDIRELIDELTSKNQIIEYGPDKLPAGPDIDKSDTIIIVEGKNDVYALIKAGYKNVIAMQGAEIPDTLVDLAKKKSKIIAFLDRDSQGIKNLKTLMTRIRVDYIAFPPEGRKEVENLTPSEIRAALSKDNLIPPDQVNKILKSDKILDGYKEIAPLLETAEKIKDDRIIAFDKQLKPIGEFRSLKEALAKKPFAIALGGYIDQTHINTILKSGHIPRIVIAKDKGELVFVPINIAVLTLKQLLVSKVRR